MVDYFVRLIGTRPRWPADMTAHEQQVMKEHFQYLVRLSRRRKVLLAGPVMEWEFAGQSKPSSSEPTRMHGLLEADLSVPDGTHAFGLIVLRVRDEAELLEIMSQEPSVLAGVHRYEVFPTKAAIVDLDPHFRHPQALGPRRVEVEITIDSAREAVWQRLTTGEGVGQFFSPDHRVELRPGGPMEILFGSATDEPGTRGSEDCRFLSWVFPRMLSFEWNAPPSFGELRYIKTQVVIELSELGPNGGNSAGTESVKGSAAVQTKVLLTHHGFGTTPEWEAVADYFDRVWPYVLQQLKTSLS